MISQPDQYEVLVVGAGQSGLAIGYYLLDVNRDGIELCPEYGARRR